MLIATGQAKCIRQAGDILEDYLEVTGVGSGMTPIVRSPREFSSPNESVLYAYLEEHGPTHPDILRTKLDLNMQELLITLSQLEILGYIELANDGKYSIIP